ncbi:MAG: HAD family hydrolase, partial [Jiangellaceae bacterium]
MSLVVGFDLDLTLVDSADGIIATYVEAGRRLGVKVDPEVVRPLIGIPLEDGSAEVVPAELVDDMVRIYREIFPAIGVPGTTLLPGAAEAVASVREHGGRAIVVSAKIEPGVSMVLDHVGLSVDEVVGGRYAEAKGEALR